jgi:hypothetical protein
VDNKLLVAIEGSTQAQQARASGAAVVAEYPDSLLIRATPVQRQQLEQAGLEVAELPQPPVQLAGTAFHFQHAEEPERATPLAEPPADRRSYYLVQLVGPVKGDWLNLIRSLGGVIHGSSAGYSVVVAILPPQVEKLCQQLWVEGVTPYRPAMKVASKLPPGAPAQLNADALTALESPADAAPAQQVEITVFPSESTSEVATKVRQGGGTVIKETPRPTVAARVPAALVADLAALTGVEPIVPHDFPKFHNDKAAEVMWSRRTGRSACSRWGGRSGRRRSAAPGMTGSGALGSTVCTCAFVAPTGL